MTKQELIIMLRHDIKEQRANNEGGHTIFVRLNGTSYYIDEGAKFEFCKNFVYIKYGKLPIAHLFYCEITSVGYSFPFEDEVKKRLNKFKQRAVWTDSRIKR